MARYMTTINAGVKPANNLAALVFLDMALQINDFHERGLFTDGQEYWLQKLQLAHHDRKKEYPRCGDLHITQSKGYDGHFSITVFASEKTYQQSKGSIFTITCIDEAVYYKPNLTSSLSPSSMKKAHQAFFKAAQTLVKEVHAKTPPPYYIHSYHFCLQLEELAIGQKDLGIDWSNTNHAIYVKRFKGEQHQQLFSITFKKQWGLEGDY